MKKITLFAVGLFSILSSFNANAQSYTIDKDSSKEAWAKAGVLVDTKIKVTVGSAPITLDWSMTNFVADAGWNFAGTCDPSNCYPAGESGLKDGSKSFSTFSLAAGSSGTYIVDFEGDAAASGTRAYAVIQMSDGTTTKNGVFYASKSATGISTTFKNDAVVNIFPNPAQNYIDVIYNANSDVKTIAIYNLIGKSVNVYKVTDKNSAHCEFNADMPSGIYVVRIADSKGNIIATRKITRQ